MFTGPFPACRLGRVKRAADNARANHFQQPNPWDEKRLVLMLLFIIATYRPKLRFSDAVAPVQRPI